ncbi:ABC transporter ATP-binding protein [Vulcanisaeta thermophila]|uniref:ABC transporter ATP-binding protein n=1 Tax=Vulcanisaeta thermophila TaxID=867917 RepID=UPI000853D1D9|nr:ABC transporter ATP-binding protein [Vulcanisaeta thermophila]
MDRAVEFHNAGIGYGRIVIDGLSLRIPRPGLTTILGPNGSGKTTILRALIKFSRLFHGKVYIDGIDLDKLGIEDLPRHVSYSPAEIENPMFMTVLDVVSSARGVNGWVSNEEAIKALEYLGIGGLAHRRFSELSTGQKRLVIIARAVASGARLLILDEPTSNLDLGNKYRVISTLRRLVQDLGVAIVSATHDIDLALASDLVVAIRDGRLVAVGDPASVIREDVLSSVYGVKVRIARVDGRVLVYVVDGNYQINNK